MTIVDKAVDAVAPLLGGLGFQRRGDAAIFTVDLSNGVLGWLGLNTAAKYRRGSSVEINPVVGVRHQAVERLVAELRGENFHPFIPPTVSRPLGYLTPANSYVAWTFELTSLAVRAAELASAIEQFALPAMRSMTNLAEVARRMDDGWGYAHQLAYRKPAIQWLRDDQHGAIRALGAVINELGERRDPAAEDLRAFAMAFQAKVRAEH